MKNSLRHIPTFLMFAAVASTASAADSYQISSPDGKLTVEVSCPGGVPTYSVVYDGAQFIAPSALGLKMNLGDYTRNMTLTKATPVESVTDSYSLPNIKKSHVDYTANAQTFTFASDDNTEIYDIEWQVSNNNIGFRYALHPRKDIYGAVVTGEATSFVMPEGTTTFICEQSKAMGGWSNTYPSYETGYTPDDEPGKNGCGEGYTFPCLFHNGDKGWTLISETGVDGRYVAGRLMGGNGLTYSIGFPQTAEMRGTARSNARVTLPSKTPWRTITVGSTMAPIAETTITFDLVRPKYAAKHEHNYGKGTWSWIIGMEPSMNYDEQKRYIDFTHEIGYETLLVDALWDTQVGRDKVEELARYAKSRGVDFYLWYNSNGSWNDAFQGPRNYMATSHERREEMAWMQSIGIRGIKVDFFGGDNQEMMQLYEDILSDANDFGLLVIFHGCTLPRGWERMFPAYAASEAVLASENLSFSQQSDDLEAYNATIHPILRNTVGSMDFGGSALNKYYNAANKPGGKIRRTSDVFALATAVLFQSPVQHFAIAPNNLTDAPAWAMDFMKEVPTTWDDVKYIDGYPGRYLIMARRCGDKWYIAGINAQDEPLKTSVEMPMLQPNAEGILYADTEKKTIGGETTKLKKGKLKVSVPKDGAFLFVAPAN